MRLGLIALSVAPTLLAQEPAPLPGKGLAQHPFLCCGEWQDRGRSEQVMRIVRGGRVVWTYSISGNEEYGDCRLMSNGNIVFSRRLGASEITPDKKIVCSTNRASPKTATRRGNSVGRRAAPTGRGTRSGASL
jgi:hypothetical protein